MPMTPVSQRILTAGLLAVSVLMPVHAMAQWLLPNASHAVEAPLPEATQAAPEPTAPARAPRNARNGKQTARAEAKREQPEYYIEFRSRGAVSYGHTFLMHGRIGKSGELVPGEVAGLHPAGGAAEYMAGHMLPVPAETGPSDGDLEERYVTARYRITLSAEQYEKVVGYIRHKQQTTKMWHAVLNNCNGFVADIGSYMGLKAPSAMLLPADFIKSMRAMNGGVSRIALYQAANAAQPE